MRNRSAPFDHPQLFVPKGEVGYDTNVVKLFGYALDNVLEIPATGQTAVYRWPSSSTYRSRDIGRYLS